jgi:hypothetical protein
MDSGILKEILKKLDIKESDIHAIGETWPMEDLSQINMEGTIRGPYQYYDIELKNKKKFFLKRNHLTKIIRSIEDIGYHLI